METSKELLIKVANLYYQQNLSQESIAKMLFLSRSTVSRILISARKCGIVEVIIHEGFERNKFLEQEFINRFHLHDVRIIKQNEADKDFSEVVQCAARYIDSLLDNSSVIGLTRGKIIDSLIDKLPKDRHIPINVVQLIGTMEWSAGKYEEMETARKFATKYGGCCHYLLGPFVAEDESTLNTLCNIEANKKTFEYAKKANVLIHSVGAITDDEIKQLWGNYLLPQEADLLASHHTAGVCCGYYYDIHGNFLDLHFTKHIVGITPSDIRCIPLRVCIAPGIEKADAIVGAIRSQLCNILITDERTALEVLLKEYGSGQQS